MNLQEQLENADALIGQGNYMAAMSSYSDILKENPECDEAWLMLGSLYGETGQIDRAIEHVQKAIDINPKDSYAHLTLGHIKNAKGDKAGALEAMLKATECDPDNVEALCTLASLYQAQGDLKGAIKAFENAVILDDSLIDAWSMLGSLHFQENNVDRAESCFRKALSLGSSDTATLLGLCSLLNHGNRASEVLEMLNNLPGESNSDPEILYQLAMANSKEGIHQQALDLIEKAIAVKSLDRYVLGKAEILQTKSDYEGAFELIKPYLEVKPPDVIAVTIFSKFCRIIDLDKECLQLLDQLINSAQLSPMELSVAEQAKDWILHSKSKV